MNTVFKCPTNTLTYQKIMKSPKKETYVTTYVLSSIHKPTFQIFRYCKTFSVINCINKAISIITISCKIFWEKWVFIKSRRIYDFEIINLFIIFKFVFEVIFNSRTVSFFEFFITELKTINSENKVFKFWIPKMSNHNYRVTLLESF